MPNTGVDRAIHVVAAVIHHPQNPNKIFLAQRKAGQHLENLWEFPGGKLEPGEPRFHGLRRELEEEVGIFVHAARPLNSVSHRYPDKRVFLDVWRVTAYSGTPHSREKQRVEWVDIQDLHQYPMPDADIPVVKALSLPGEILITPDVDPQYLESFIDQFKRVMRSHPYRLVGFRSHGLSDGNYAEIATQLAHIAGSTGGDLIIHRPSLGALKSARFKPFAHRHLSAAMLNTAKQSLAKVDCQWSASCHDLDELRKAGQLGCRFAYLSSVRETLSHPGRPGKGWQGFARLAHQSPVPVYALGGVCRQDRSAANYQGAVGVAGIRDFWSA